MKTIAVAFMLLSPCFIPRGCGSDVPPTKEEATVRAEGTLAEYLETKLQDRTGFGEAEVHLQQHDGGALVQFRDVRFPDQGVTINLGKEGCVSVSPILVKP
jgi:hypothetical protein